MPRHRPHAKVHVSVAHHEKTADVWADPEQRGILVELWRLAVERYAAKRGGTLRLRPGDVMSTTGRATFEEGLSTLRAVCEGVGYRCVSYPNRVDVSIRKFAKKQYIGGEESDTETGASPPESLSPRKQKAESRKQKAESRITTSKPPPSADGMALAEFFRSELENVPRATRPKNLDGWARTFDLMTRGTRDVEPIPPDEIRSVIRWVVRDDFEQANVQSPKKLRARYAGLLAKSKRPVRVVGRVEPTRAFDGEDWQHG